MDWDKIKETQYNLVNSNPTRTPCTDEGIDNQCAIRVSIALKAGGITINTPKRPFSEEAGFGPLCSHGNARGANPLCKYLIKYFFAYRTFSRQPELPTTNLEKIKVKAPGDIIGDYVGNIDDGFMFLPLFKYLEYKKSLKQVLRGFMYFNNPRHIDVFDIEDTNYGSKDNKYVIGESYHDSSSEVVVVFA